MMRDNIKAVMVLVNTVFLSVLLLAGLSRADAASFDCKKASAAIEDQICRTPKLSALDDELAEVYREALKLVSTPSAFKKTQQKWIKKERNASGNSGDIEAAYLARIEEIRLDPEVKKKLFAQSVPPARIFGRYSETEPLCFNPKDGADEYDCAHGDVENYIDLRPGPGNAVIVKGELWFFNGHQCGPFEGIGEWVNGILRFPQLQEENRCVLLLRFSDGKVITEDPASLCKQALLCGANAGLHNIVLPKVTSDAKGKKADNKGRKREIPGRNN